MRTWVVGWWCAEMYATREGSVTSPPSWREERWCAERKGMEEKLRRGEDPTCVCEVWKAGALLLFLFFPKCLPMPVPGVACPREGSTVKNKNGRARAGEEGRAGWHKKAKAHGPNAP